MWLADMMIDWVSSHAVKGCGRSFFSGRPSEPLVGFVRLTASWRELATISVPIGDRGAVIARAGVTGQMMAKASSPSSVKM